MGLSLAYHKALDKKGLHHLSLAAQTTLSTYAYSYDGYGTQYDEAGGGYRSNYNWGILYSGMLSKVTSLFGGLSRYGNGMPYGSDRYTALTGMSFHLGPNNTLFTNVSYDLQRGSGGTLRISHYARFVLNPSRPEGKGSPIAAYAGATFIYGQAVLPYLGFEAANMRLGIGIDTRAFSGNTPATGGYQVSLIYQGIIPTKKANNWHCAVSY